MPPDWAGRVTGNFYRGDTRTWGAVRALGCRVGHRRYRCRSAGEVTARRLGWASACAYAAALSLASIGRHERFETGGYDLGIFDQGVWLLGQGFRPFSTIRGRDLFADHFQPALVLLAPLGALGVTPTALLILQSVLLAAVAPPLYALARRRGAAPPLALAVALLWLASPLTQWANLFDFHPETAVPVLLALAALQLDRGRNGRFVGLAVAASLFKEDVSLVFLGWGVLLALQGRRRLGLALAAGATLWFVLATQMMIPAFGGNLDYYSARFGGDRGSSLGAVFRSFLDHPLRAISDVSTPANAKVLMVLVLASGGLALLAPALLLPALPTVSANLLSAYSYQHELQFHYHLIPAAFFAVASAHGAGVLQRHRGRLARVGRTAPALLTSGTLALAALGPASQELRSVAGPNQDVRERALALIPPDAPTAAAPLLVPHLAHRRDIYQLPEPFFSRPTNGEYWTERQLRRRAQKVEWVVYELAGLDPWPRSQVQTLPQMLHRRGFIEIFHDTSVRVFCSPNRISTSAPGPHSSAVRPCPQPRAPEF